ncbi:SWIM zinc finger family protein [Streptomyces sp. NPDC050211]|uniref:SWIM zinc finger family protein n=1 Tax=Streptomyces sp. NPDC050211 TaxID=3154932 RepID=UPI003421D824
MTPHPADEARRALRAARERAGRPEAGAGEQRSGAEAERGADVTAPEEAVTTGRLATGGAWAGDGGAAGGAARAGGGEAAGDDVGRTAGGTSGGAPRPSDVARAALRDAVSGRRAAAADKAGGASAAGASAGAGGGETSAEEGNRVRDEGAEGVARDRAVSGQGRGRGAATHARTAPEGSGDARVARPADVARQALRAARGEGREEGADGAVEPSPRPSSLARTESVEERRGHARAAQSRARALSDLVADSFRMPAADELPEEEPAETPTSPRHPGSPNALARPDARVPTTHSRPRSSAGTYLRAGTSLTELRRTFPAFGPLPSEGGGFAATWWGNAWVAALEEGALDAKRLARGRGYAQQGNVEAITVTPGLVLAYVQGSRPRPYRVQLRLRTLEDADWERFLDTAAERPGHIAALLDKELPQSLADCGVPLLPGPGDLAPQCSCPDRGHPCKHAAALCYQTARLLDADPFVLLLLRGRGERELLDALSRRNAARAARAAQEREPAPLPGVRATDALAPRQLPPLPAPPPALPHPGQPPVYPAAPGGPDPFALDQLATDAALRAHTLLATGRDPVAELTLWQDAVRLAAARPGSGLTAGTRALYSSLASAAGRTPAELARAVAAWRQGGLEGLAVLEEPWDPPAGRFDRARPLLLAADLPAFRPWRNRLTHPRGHVQLRLGRDGIWYPYESEPGHDDWWPRGTPDLDPVGALTGLGTSSAD